MFQRQLRIGIPNTIFRNTFQRHREWIKIGEWIFSLDHALKAFKDEV